MSVNVSNGGGKGVSNNMLDEIDVCTPCGRHCGGRGGGGGADAYVAAVGVVGESSFEGSEVVLV